MKLSSLLEFDVPTQLPLHRLDWAFAQWLQSRQPSNDPRHLWLAALTSHQWGRGHACLDLSLLQTQAADLLGWTAEQAAALPSDWVQAAQTLAWTQGDASPLVIHPDHTRLYLRRAWLAEQSIRQSLQARLALPVSTPKDLSARLDRLFEPKASGVPDRQRMACEVAAQNRITLITGGPGTGKTTTVVRLLAVLVGASESALRIHLVAPTGKAAARLSESIRHALRQMPSDVQSRIPTQAQTLHRLLHLHRHTQTVQALATDVVVVDEASMVDLETMARLLQAVPHSARLILLGDKDQLASVEAGAVMAQLCAGPLLTAQTVTLTQSHRFDAQSGIGRWAQAIQNVQAPDTSALATLWQEAPDALADPAWPADVTRLTWRRAQDPQLAPLLRAGWHRWLQALAPHRSDADPHARAQPCSDAQAAALLQAFGSFCVLCALREGPLGVRQLNAQAERALGLGASPWYVGRPVMVTRNDYALDLMNGDTGLCLPGPDGVLRVAFAGAEGGVRWFMPSRLESVETVFAMTVHKSQGSEFAHVLLVLPDEMTPVLTRELVYTGVTRARERLTIWAPDPKVLFGACTRQVLRSGGLADPV